MHICVGVCTAYMIRVPVDKKFQEHIDWHELLSLATDALRNFANDVVSQFAVSAHTFIGFMSGWGFPAPDLRVLHAPCCTCQEAIAGKPWLQSVNWEAMASKQWLQISNWEATALGSNSGKASAANFELGSHG